MEIRAQLTEWSDSVAILIGELDHTTGKIGFIAKPIEFIMETYTLGLIAKPTIELDARSAVGLMTALWKAGIRPGDYKSADGEIKRLEDHLADMRTLVFK
jgi:hypothetical protein